MDAATGIGLAISAVAALSAVGAVIASLRNGRKIQEVHLSVNSRFDAFLLATKAAGFAEGIEHARVNAAADVVALADARAKVLDQDAARG